MSDDDPAPPIDLPEGVAEQLQDLDTHHLREVAIYVQELLQHRRADRGPPIEAEPGEEIVTIEEREGYTVVVKREPCGNPDCEECPHGPYLYYVETETHPDGSETTHWTLIGRTTEERWTS
ncbi:MAG: hypothetical protein ABEJ22_08040 [Haloferacaceae archaeon]